MEVVDLRLYGELGAEMQLKGPTTNDPVPSQSYGKFIAKQLKLHGKRIAQIDVITKEQLTFDDILTKSLSVAEALSIYGLQQGDAIGVLSGNSLDFCLPALAALYLGVACAPLNPTYTQRELIHALNISKPKIIFVSAQIVQKIDELQGKLNFLKHVIVMGTSVPHQYIPLSALLRNKSQSFKPIDVDPNECVACIMCSSGTTGMPKGVMLTHSNIMYVYYTQKNPNCGNMTADKTYIGLLPFFHAYAYVMQLVCLAIGLKCIVMPRFEEEMFLKAIQDYKVSLLMMVPPLLVFLAKHPLVAKYDLSSLRDIICGAAPLSKEVQTQVMERIHVKQIRQGYGMTETSLGVLVTPPNKNKFGSSGVLAPFTECKVIDVESGKVLGPNLSGELCFKGPLIMKGYCGDNSSTLQIIDKDGWLHTGDVGYYDADGFFFVVDRVKELIKYKGFQVPPAELEAILLTHPCVKDAAVIGIPDEIAGELPTAFVIRQPGVNVSAQEIIDYVSKQVSPQKRLHGGVRFVETIPKTASGKILRRHLRDMIKAKL